MFSTELPPRIVEEIGFIGRGSGAVKSLGGFRKGHHTLPDTANAVTNAFLGKICEHELTEEAEKLFQEVRAGLGYKRKDVTLSVTSPRAVLLARDFAVEMEYVLEEREPTRYATTMRLGGVKRVELLRTDAFERIFAGKFAEISFGLRKGAKVEAVIDAIEGLDVGCGMTVSYPSDYRECTVRVEGVDAAVRCTGAALEMVFRRGSSPAELVEAFTAVREAFQISKALGGLIG